MPTLTDEGRAYLYAKHAKLTKKAKPTRKRTSHPHWRAFKRGMNNELDRSYARWHGHWPSGKPYRPYMDDDDDYLIWQMSRH